MGGKDIARERLAVDAIQRRGKAFQHDSPATDGVGNAVARGWQGYRQGTPCPYSATMMAYRMEA
jgi:hypothetical protein